MKIETTRQVIEYFISELGPGLVPDNDMIWAWPPDWVREELERRLNAIQDDDSTPSLFD